MTAFQQTRPAGAPSAWTTGFRYRAVTNITFTGHVFTPLTTHPHESAESYRNRTLDQARLLTFLRRPAEVVVSVIIEQQLDNGEWEAIGPI